jgi:hypothetical protein
MPFSAHEARHQAATTTGTKHDEERPGGDSVEVFGKKLIKNIPCETTMEAKRR